jgi:hypothetical protein
MPLKMIGTVADSTVSVQSLMQGIELVWSYRSNVPAARGLAGYSSSSMDLGSHLISRAKQNFWNQWDAAAELQRILGSRYMISNKSQTSFCIVPRV